MLRCRGQAIPVVMKELVLSVGLDAQHVSSSRFRRARASGRVGHASDGSLAPGRLTSFRNGNCRRPMDHTDGCSGLWK